MREAGGPGGVKEVATGLEKNYKTVAALMQKMLKAGTLSSPAYGKYEAANPEPAVEVPTIPTVPTGHTGEQNSPTPSPVGSVGTVRTSRKPTHSGVGTDEEDEDTPAATDVAEQLADPPEWLRRQTDKHLKNPREGTLKALCASVALEVLGNPRRGEEVRPAVEEALRGERGAP